MPTRVPNSVDQTVCRMEFRLRLDIHTRRSKIHPAIFEEHDSGSLTASPSRQAQWLRTPRQVQLTKNLSKIQQGFVWPKNPQTGDLKSIQIFGDNKMSKDAPDSKTNTMVNAKNMTAAALPRHYHAKHNDSGHQDKYNRRKISTRYNRDLFGPKIPKLGI